MVKVLIGPSAALRVLFLESDRADWLAQPCSKNDAIVYPQLAYELFPIEHVQEPPRGAQKGQKRSGRRSRTFFLIVVLRMEQQIFLHLLHIDGAVEL
jgi:hypothetical protein